MTDPTPSQRDLFEIALTLAPGERVAYLARHCADAQMRALLERMLAADAAAATQLLDEPFDVLLERVDEDGEDLAAPSAGMAVGPFVLGEKLGEGGSSIVFRAAREQAGVRQDVALKLLRRGVYSSEEQRRFRGERRALAGLRHPGIARLIEGGVTETGVPYIALELVDGMPITEYARTHALDLDARVRLVAAVCRAVEAAHRALIVHRDLKPSNVLVTREGEVKLLDFGIAKLLDREAETDATRTQGIAMTPAYAAPEQFNRGLITTATDVYALGLLLAELLTGRRRERGDARTPSAQIAGRPGDTAPPLAPAVLRKRLRGDLDNIVVKAIDAEPERRYASAGALADDLERHLAGLPVAAHPPSRTYRARKFVARHRGAVASTLMVALAVLAALAIALWQANAARAAAARADTIKNFLLDVFRASDPRVAQDKPRGQITAKELLDLNAPRIAQEFAGDTDTEIELLGVAASIYRELDDDPRYRALHAQQVDLARRTHGDAHPAIVDGLIDDAQHASDGNDYANARALLAQADGLIRRGRLEDSVQRARWWQVSAGLLPDDAAGRAASGEASRRAVDLFARVAPEHPGYVRALDTLAFQTQSANPAQAEQYYLRAIAAAEGAHAHEDAELQHLTYPGLAQVREDQGDFDGAERAYERGAELARKTYGETHSTAWVPAAQYAWMVHRHGKRDQAHALFAQLMKAIPPDWTADSYDEYAREFYASCLAAEGRAGEAIPLLEAAQRVYVEKPGVDYELRRNRLILGDAYDRVGRSDDARAMLRASLDERIAKEAPDARTVIDARERWARFLLDRGELAGVEEQLREVFARSGDRAAAPVALAEGDWARLSIARGDMAGAQAHSERAVALFERVTGRHDVRIGPQLWLIRAAVLREAGDDAGAHALALRAYEASLRYDDRAAPSIAAAAAAMKASQ